MNNLERQQRESVIEITPTTLQDYFGILIEAVRNGELNALELYGKAKEIEELAQKFGTLPSLQLQQNHACQPSSKPLY